MTITEKKRNDIIEIPVRANDEHNLQELHQKVDNDMESSDLGFSEDANEVDEHEYQIGELG